MGPQQASQPNLRVLRSGQEVLGERSAGSGTPAEQSRELGSGFSPGLRNPSAPPLESGQGRPQDFPFPSGPAGWDSGHTPVAGAESWKVAQRGGAQLRASSRGGTKEQSRPRDPGGTARAEAEGGVGRPLPGLPSSLRRGLSKQGEQGDVTRPESWRLPW